ncbi:MAG: hypothetical protein ACJ77M_14550, partial [Thermoleophilaceae bacterium]
MERLRRIRIAYVLGAIGLLAIAGVLVVTLSNDDSAKKPAPPGPQRVEIGGGKGPRSCVVRSAPLSETHTLSDSETSTASAPVRVTAAENVGGSVARATVSNRVTEAATATGRSSFTLNVKGRAAVCARAKSPEEAQRRADAVARRRAEKQARALLKAALARTEGPARSKLVARTHAEATAAARARLEAALPAARADAA